VTESASTDSRLADYLSDMSESVQNIVTILVHEKEYPLSKALSLVDKHCKEQLHKVEKELS